VRPSASRQFRHLYQGEQDPRGIGLARAGAMRGLESLGIPTSLLQDKGAVCRDVAAAMAHGAGGWVWCHGSGGCLTKPPASGPIARTVSRAGLASHVAVTEASPSPPPATHRGMLMAVEATVPRAPSRGSDWVENVRAPGGAILPSVSRWQEERSALVATATDLQTDKRILRLDRLCSFPIGPRSSIGPRSKDADEGQPAPCKDANTKAAAASAPVADRREKLSVSLRHAIR
jgi:hypothetical protein